VYRRRERLCWKLWRQMGEFLKGYIAKITGKGGGYASYAQDGDSRGLAQACDKAMRFIGVEQRC
jgi:hypothetical protein